MAELQPYVITTQHRGVFFGYCTPLNGHVPSELRLERARMCVYWPDTEHGVFGLASQGPLKGSRVGPAVPEVYLRDVTAAIGVTEGAIGRWETEPWG